MNEEARTTWERIFVQALLFRNYSSICGDYMFKECRLNVTVFLMSEAYKNYFGHPLEMKGMFQEPAYYSKLSEDYKRETKWVMERCWDQLEWGPAEDLLDVGCGSGDALYHIIRPDLPQDFNSLVGVDVSKKMIDFANAKFQDPRVHFQVLDISTKKDPLSFFSRDIQTEGGFHKITSFFCLQWVKDRRQMLENLYKLLRPGGFAVLHLVVRSAVYNLWDKLAVSERWCKYFNDVQLPFNEYVYMDNHYNVLSEEARCVGFTVKACQVHDRKRIFTANTNSDDEIKVRLRSVDPLVSRLPQELQADYMDELLATLKRDVTVFGASDYTGLLMLLHKE